MSSACVGRIHVELKRAVVMVLVLIEVPALARVGRMFEVLGSEKMT